MKDEIVRFIRAAVEANGYAGAVVGISGGVDSAVVGALAVEALGKRNVLGILLPERDSAPETLKDSLAVCDFLGIERIVKPITRVLRALGVYRLEPPAFFVPRKVKERYVRQKVEAFGKDEAFLRDLEGGGDEEFLRGAAYYRSKHRVRMVCLYLEAERRNFAVVGTTNRTEALTGFFVKWGDDSADIEPIIHLYKTQVFDLAKALRIPDRITAKKPSPDLLPGLTDEFALGMSYAELDSILMKIEQGRDLSDERLEAVEKVRRILRAARKRHLRNLALRGWEMPA